MSTKTILTTVVFLLSVLVKGLEGACMFGTDCLFPCRCQEESCDTQTGTCVTTNRCSPDYPPIQPWSGPGCQVGNLAYDKQDIRTNHEISQPLVDGIVATDGDLDTCVFIDTDDAWINPYWQVNLESSSVMNTVDIYSKILDGYSSNDFIAKISVTLSLTEDFTQASPCTLYEDRLPEDGRISIICEHSNPYQFVRVTRLAVSSDVDPRPYEFNLCEVVVVGHLYLNVDCDKCVDQHIDGTCGNEIWCEECQPGYQSPDCTMASSVVNTTTASTTTSTMTSSDEATPTSMTSSTTTTTVTSQTPSTMTSTTSSSSTASSTTALIPSNSATDSALPNNNGGNTDMFSGPPSSTQIFSDENDDESKNDTSVQLITYTVVGIVAVILVTLIILGICVCVRRNRLRKAMGNTPNSTLSRRPIRNNNYLDRGNLNNGYQFEEEFVDNLSRRSSLLDITVMDTIKEEREKDSSKHSSCSSLHSSTVKNEGNGSMNGSVKRISNRSL